MRIATPVIGRPSRWAYPKLRLEQSGTICISIVYFHSMFRRIGEVCFLKKDDINVFCRSLYLFLTFENFLRVCITHCL